MKNNMFIAMILLVADVEVVVVAVVKVVVVVDSTDD
jgi:hypothetical protein